MEESQYNQAFSRRGWAADPTSWPRGLWRAGLTFSNWPRDLWWSTDQKNIEISKRGAGVYLVRIGSVFLFYVRVGLRGRVTVRVRDWAESTALPRSHQEVLPSSQTRTAHHPNDQRDQIAG